MAAFRRSNGDDPSLQEPDDADFLMAIVALGHHAGVKQRGHAVPEQLAATEFKVTLPGQKQLGDTAIGPGPMSVLG